MGTSDNPLVTRESAQFSGPDDIRVEFVNPEPDDLVAHIIDIFRSNRRRGSSMVYPDGCVAIDKKAPRNT